LVHLLFIIAIPGAFTGMTVRNAKGELIPKNRSGIPPILEEKGHECERLQGFDGSDHHNRKGGRLW